MYSTAERGTRGWSKTAADHDCIVRGIVVAETVAGRSRLQVNLRASQQAVEDRRISGLRIRLPGHSCDPGPIRDAFGPRIWRTRWAFRLYVTVWKRNGDSGPQHPGQLACGTFSREELWAIACNTVAGAPSSRSERRTSNLPWRIRMVFFMLVKARIQPSIRGWTHRARGAIRFPQDLQRFFLTSG